MKKMAIVAVGVLVFLALAGATMFAAARMADSVVGAIVPLQA